MELNVDLSLIENMSVKDFIKLFVNFNKKRDLLKQGSNPYRHTCYVLEELLEDLGIEDSKKISKSMARSLISNIEQKKLKKDTYIYLDLYELDNEDVRKNIEKYKDSKRPKSYYEKSFDSKIDLCIYTFGELAKEMAEIFGDDEELISKGIASMFVQVINACEKKGTQTNNGQIVKPENFEEPKLLK